MFSFEVKNSIEKSVLCWLATADATGLPNVSPKEIFTHFDDSQLLIAHIASPKSVKNIIANPKVCVSFIDIFVQKGYKLIGEARILTSGDDDFVERYDLLKDMAGDKFPFAVIIEVTAHKIEQIVAPSYRMYPDTTTEEKQIENAKRAYGVHGDL